MLRSFTDILTEADADLVSAPVLATATKDGRLFSRLGIHTHGFVPMPLPEDLDFGHFVQSADEQIPVNPVAFGMDATYELLQRFWRMG